MRLPSLHNGPRLQVGGSKDTAPHTRMNQPGRGGACSEMLPPPRLPCSFHLPLSLPPCFTPDRVRPETWWPTSQDGVGQPQVWGILTSPAAQSLAAERLRPLWPLGCGGLRWGACPLRDGG